MRPVLALAALLVLVGCSPKKAKPEPLPSFETPWELYSWKVDTDWNYALVGGRNRPPTVAGLRSTDGYLRADGVKVVVRGEMGAAGLFVRLEKGQKVVWRGAERDGFSLPPKADQEQLAAVAAQRGVALELDAR